MPQLDTGPNLTVHACRYDKDGSGELETMEFVEAVRQTGASEDICTNKELYKLFREVSARKIRPIVTQAISHESLYESSHDGKTTSSTESLETAAQTTAVPCRFRSEITRV